MWTCATAGCEAAYGGLCEEPCFCSLCLADLTPLSAVTWPTHEDQVGRIVVLIAEEVQRATEAALRGRTREEQLRTVVETYHRRGIPAVNARYEGDCIVTDVVRPRGYG